MPDLMVSHWAQVFHDFFPNGGDLLPWRDMAATVQKFIVENHLAPAEVTVRTQGPLQAGAPKVEAHVVSGEIAAAARLMDPGIRGGIRVAHLHFNNQIYMLTPEQWTKFSTQIVTDAKAMLEKVKVVSFEDAMMLASVTHALPKQ